MRILQVSHAFPPESTGGTEVYTCLLSQALQVRHELAICYRICDPARTEYELIPGTFKSLPVYRLVNNFTWSQGPDFEFFAPGLEAKFESVLDIVQPDIVHFQHLGGGLSTSFPHLAQRRGLPILLTLHDFWPMCYLSHLLTSDKHLCIGPEGGLRCVQCWLRTTTEGKVSIPRRVRELGLRNSLKLAPRFILDSLGLREYLPPVAYHTTRLMARDTYFRHLLERFDLLLAPSQFLRQQYILWGIPPERIRFVQNGVDASKFTGLTEALPLGPNLQAVYIGSLLRYKGLDVLVDAFNRLAGLPITLRIYGDTKASPQTEDYVRILRSRLTNPQVTFPGPFTNDRIGEVLSQADLVILPSLVYENCPMVILEAFYASRPVVASNIGGMAELVRDGVNGLTFRVGDAVHLAKKLSGLCQDRSVLLEFQRHIVRPRTMESVAADVEACYQQLLHRNGARCSSTRGGTNGS